jgi:hypothetical protein
MDPAAFDPLSTGVHAAARHHPAQSLAAFDCSPRIGIEFLCHDQSVAIGRDPAAAEPEISGMSTDPVFGAYAVIGTNVRRPTKWPWKKRNTGATTNRLAS